jgi:hypothetical protein
MHGDKSNTSNTSRIDSIMRYPYILSYTAMHIIRALRAGVNPARLTNTVEGLERLNSMHMEIKIGNGTLAFSYKGKRIRFNFETRDDLRYTLYEIYEQFQKEEYGFVDPRGKSIIDIGSAYSDTPIYFAVNGARSVVGYEPDRQRYRLGLKNVKGNRLSSKIRLKNLSVSSLSNIGSADLLKMDCEGCEYRLISERAELDKFNEIIMEYHYGYSNLKSILEDAGFNTRNRYSPYYNVHDRAIINSGILYAYR